MKRKGKMLHQRQNNSDMPTYFPLAQLVKLSTESKCFLSATMLPTYLKGRKGGQAGTNHTHTHPNSFDLGDFFTML